MNNANKADGIARQLFDANVAEFTIFERADLRVRNKNQI
jgi:hypothetical protein